MEDRDHPRPRGEKNSIDFENRIIQGSPPPTRGKAKRKLPSAPDHKLSTLARLLECDVSGEHRALDDCRTTYQVYEKLNEIG